MTDRHAIEDRLSSAPLGADATPPGLAAVAQAAGLLDVAYVTEDFPVGTLLLAATEAGLVRLAYLGVQAHDEETVLAALATRISPRVLAAPARLDGPRRQLEDYFAGRRQTFDIALDPRLMTNFTRRVLQVTAAIPYGATSTYGAIAAQAEARAAHGAAGNALGANPLPIVVPCHRVLHAGGGLGGYTGGLERKRALLALESGGGWCKERS